MQDKLEKLVGIVYKGWKSGQHKRDELHPDEEALACFLENRLPAKDLQRIRAHLLSCEACAQAFAMQVKLDGIEEKEVPQELTELAKNLLVKETGQPLLEIFLRVKVKALELINTTGDALVGQEFVPAPVLRSRSIKDFKDEITILKDFADFRVEAKIESKGARLFNLTIMVKQKQTQKVIKDLRVTLLQDDLELESYLTDSGSVIFEHVLLGRYRVDISTIENRLASVLIDIKT